MGAKVSYTQIVDRFGCSVRFLATVRSDRKQIEAAAAAGGGSQKTARKGDFPEVSYIKTLLAGRHVSIGGEKEDEQQQGSGDENTGASAVPHRLMMNCRLTSVSWKRQQRRVATETRRST